MRKPDLAKAKADVAAFAKLAGRPLAKFQAEALALDARTSYILGPRQSGKSRGASVLAAWRAFRESDHHVLIVSASDLGAKRLLASIAEIVVGSPLLSASIVDEQASLIRLSNGSTIRSVPASTKAIRGWSIDSLIFDEATELGDEIIDAALPTTAARPDARIVFLSTGGAPVGRAFETYMAGLDPRSEHLRSFKWGLRDAKWISKGVIEHARLTMPPWRFALEYEAEWAGAIDALFSPDLLRATSADFELPDLDHLSGPARILGGVDWAASGPDQTCVVAIARIPSGSRNAPPVFVAWPARVFPAAHSITDAATEIASSPARWEVLSYELNGVGAGPSEILERRIRSRSDAERSAWTHGGGELHDFAAPMHRRNPTWTSWERKADSLGRLRVLAETGQLLFARQEQFQRQLASVRVEHRAHSVGIEAPSGGHDDLVDALYLASGSYGGRSGVAVQNVLARLAQRAHPEPPLPEPEDVVEIDGRTFARRPALLSVAGDEVTRPAPAGATARPEDDPFFIWRQQIKQHRQQEVSR